MSPSLLPLPDPAIIALAQRATVAAGIGFWACDLTDSRLSWSVGVYDLFGFERGVPIDRDATVAMYAAASRNEMERLRAAAIETGEGFSLDARIFRTDGAPRWMRLTAHVERHDGRAIRLFGIKQDITVDRLRADELRRRADRDALTGLYGRAAFQRLFDDGDWGAVALIDLDHFKQINDRFGHAAGDACLCAVATRLSAALPEASIVARIGGDEFAALFARGEREATIRAALDRALAACRAPIRHDDRGFVVGASAGLALAGPRCRPDAVFQRADVALYAAKHAGRGQARVASLPEGLRRAG